ncbi:MAG TPA: hypothetical protein EYN66_09045, partial [Myxococcales bacterium]|nr:hypothetical protein [Myxococcales bacterium]
MNWDFRVGLGSLSCVLLLLGAGCGDGTDEPESLSVSVVQEGVVFENNPGQVSFSVPSPITALAN